jgi:hypothetical protein
MTFMPKRKSRKAEKQVLQSQSRRKVMLILGLVLGLLATSGALAQWTGLLAVAPVMVRSPQTTRSQSENTQVAPDALTSGSPAKEYIYAGGRLVATEEPPAGICSYPLSPTPQNFPATGGNGSFTVGAGPGCNWTAVSNATWITNVSPASGSGSGTVNFTVGTNSGAARSGTITVQTQTLTINQGAAGATGSFSASLNGSTAYVSVPNSTSLDITGSITVEAWIKTPTPSAAQQGIIERFAASNGGYALRLAAGKLQFFTLQNATTFDYVEGGSVITTGWHHVAGVWDGTQLRLYLDGVLTGLKNSSFAPGTGTNSLKIGGRGDDASFKFNGLIDEARVTAAAVYTGMSFTVQQQLASVTGTRGLWKFDNQSTADASGNGNTGSLTGGATYSSDVPGGCISPVASPPSLPGTDTVWFDDALPTGASVDSTWLWDTRQKASGTQSHADPLTDGIHQHYFFGATQQPLPVSPGDTLVCYVLLDPCNPPQEVMLQFMWDSWEHRAYWGQDLIPWGTNNTASRFPMGALPATGQWARLEVPAANIGITSQTGQVNITGFAASLYGGMAWFDRVCKATGAPPPGDNAAFISQTAPPGSMTPGQTASVTVTMQNTGTTTWTTAGGYKLGSQNPANNSTWGLSQVSLPSSVAPNAQVTFNFTITAPSTVGTYNFQWQMLKNTTSFGNPSTNVSVNVPNPPGNCPNVSTLSGSGVSGYLEGTGTAAQWNAPRGGVIGKDPVSNNLALFVADTTNNRIRMVYLEGASAGQSVLLAGNGVAGYQNSSDPLLCRYNGPQGITATLDTNGIVTALIIADTDNHVIRKLAAPVSGTAWIPSMIAGAHGVPGYVNGNSSLSRFNLPRGITAYGGVIYCTDLGDASSLGNIRKIDSSNNTTGLVIGLANPFGVTISQTSGMLYFTDLNNHSVWQCTSAGAVSLVAGSGASGSADGTGSAASFNRPRHLAWLNTAGSELLYVAAQSNHKVRKIVISTAVVTTYAGSGTSGYLDGTCSSALFFNPQGIACALGGEVYVLDTDNHRIRKLQ